jgi:hypothetical protein
LLLPQGEGRKLPLLLGEGRGEGKNLAIQEVIAKALFPTAVIRLIVSNIFRTFYIGSLGYLISGKNFLFLKSANSSVSAIIFHLTANLLRW